MRSVEADDELTGTIIEMSIETTNGVYVYVFSDETPVEHLGVVVHDLAQILLSEGEVIVHANFLFQEKLSGSEFLPQGLE
jgi:hypothetical protein